MSITSKLIVFVAFTALVLEHLFNGPSRTMTWVTETLLFIMGYLITAFNPESFETSGCDFWEERNPGEVGRKASSFINYVHEKQCMGRIAGNEQNGPGEKYAFVLVMFILLYSIPKIFPLSVTSSDSAYEPETDSDSSTGLEQLSLPGGFHMGHDKSTDIHHSNERAMVEVKEDTKQGLASDSDPDIGLSQLLLSYPVLNIHEDTAKDTAKDTVINEEAVKKVNEKPEAEKKSETEQKPGKEQKSDSGHSTRAAEFSLPGVFIDFSEESIVASTNIEEAKNKARRARRAFKEKLTLDNP